MARQLDRLNASNSQGIAFQRLWQRNCEIVEANDADLQSQITALANLNSDDVLTPAKKPLWIFMHSFLTGEQAALDAEATAYGITTEKTNYDNAISALTTYLATLTTDVAWNDLTGNTTITGTTLRSKFNDVMTTKQALLNKMHDSAKTLADTAQTSANSAQSTANTANSTANTAKRDDAISASATAPTSILSATDAGSNATISIAAHDRIYGDGTVVSINAGSITALAYSTTYAVYYDDTARTGGSKTFVATTTLKDAQYNKAAGRHFCGQVTTPASGGAPSSGGPGVPGGGGPYP